MAGSEVWMEPEAKPAPKRERLNLVSRIVAFKAHPYVKHRSAADDDKPLDYFEDLAREEIDGMSNMELLDLISIVLEDENEPIDAPAFVGSVGRAMKITEAQRSLVRLLRVCDPRYIDRATVRRNGLTEDFERVRRAGLIRSAGYETSGEADDWLNTQEGRRAMDEADTE